MPDMIAEHIERGERLYVQILSMIENIPARTDAGTEPSTLYMDILAIATEELGEWLNIALDIIDEHKHRAFDRCAAECDDILDSVNGSKYFLTFDPKETYSSISTGLSYILGILRSIKKYETVIKPTGDKIFIVHGHNHSLRDQVKDYIKSVYDQDAVILSTEPGGGRFVLEKFIDSASECGYAIILMTADDQCTTDGSVEERARQNVIFEYGFFVSRLGRANTCIILDPGVELPSDVKGITRINSNDWKANLKTEIDYWLSNRQSGSK